MDPSVCTNKMKFGDEMQKAIYIYVSMLPDYGHGNLDDSRLMEIAYIAYKNKIGVDKEYLCTELQKKFSYDNKTLVNTVNEVCSVIEEMKYNIMLIDCNNHLK